MAPEAKKEAPAVPKAEPKEKVLKAKKILERLLQPHTQKEILISRTF